MSGSPPQIETIGASHSWADARQSSRLIMSFRLVEYSRIRPQPVQVRLQVCNGSSCSTIAKRGVFRTLCLIMCRAIFTVNASGNRISVLKNYGMCGMKFRIELPLCHAHVLRGCGQGSPPERDRL